jgi:eukaryotic-like serine/threonine-protein kinase
LPALPVALESSLAARWIADVSTPGRVIGEAPQVLVVRVERPDDEPMDYTFTRSPIRIGRSPRNDLALPLKFVSARHAIVEFAEGVARYTDLGSANGSILDGRSLPPLTPGSLAEGAKVSIGSLTLTFTRRERDVPPLVEPSSVVEEASPVKPGRLTALLEELAVAPADDVEDAWRDVLFPGAVIDRFELVREIGRGAFGVVYEAKDRRLLRRVAFKAVRPGRHSRVLLRQERLQKEAEAVAQLNHPNIVSIFDAGTCSHGPYLILELLQGDTLEARLREGRFTVREALAISIGVARALAHAHAASIIHRDLKPSNIFLGRGGTVKVLDFGIATVFGAGDPDLLGTPAYMAPEQWRQGPQDSRTDIFGAAAILCEMLTGALPYRVTPERSAALEPGAEPALDAPGAPAELLELLRRALSPSPEARPSNGRAWLEALLAVERQLEGGSQSP